MIVLRFRQVLLYLQPALLVTGLTIHGCAEKMKDILTSCGTKSRLRSHMKFSFLQLDVRISALLHGGSKR